MGVSTLGDAEEARALGLRNVGSFEVLDPGVVEPTDLCMEGLVLAYGLGVVSESGLKLWPVSTSDVFVEPFQRGRCASFESGRLIWLADRFVADEEVEMVDRRDEAAFRPVCEVGAGNDECRRFGGIARLVAPGVARTLGGFDIGV